MSTTKESCSATATYQTSSSVLTGTLDTSSPAALAGSGVSVVPKRGRARLVEGGRRIRRVENAIQTAKPKRGKLRRKAQPLGVYNEGRK